MTTERSKLITRTLATLTLTCIVVLMVPVAASAAGLVVTEPGTLVGLGIALVTVGLRTRQLLRNEKKKA
jgi:hypothetical protein